MTAAGRRRASALAASRRRHPRHLVLFALVAGLLLGPGRARGGARPRRSLRRRVVAGAGAARASSRRSRCWAARRWPRRASPRSPRARCRRWPAARSRRGRSCSSRSASGAAARRRARPARRGSRWSAAAARPIGRCDAPLAPTARSTSPARWPSCGAEVGRRAAGARVGSELRLRGDGGAARRVRGLPAPARRARRDRGSRSWAMTGAARGGLAGALDAARERAARALGTGLDAPQAALLRGMVLGQDEAIGDGDQDDFQRSGLAHLLAVSGQNVLLLCTLVLALGAVAGVPLRVRLVAAARARRDLRAARRRRPVDPARGRDGDRRPRRRARRAPDLALVRARARGGRHARAQPARRRRARLAALVRGGRGPARARAPMRGALRAGACPARSPTSPRSPSPRRVATAPLMALHFEQVSLASLPANLLAAAVVAPVMWLGMIGDRASRSSRRSWRRR